MNSILLPGNHVHFETDLSFRKNDCEIEIGANFMYSHTFGLNFTLFNFLICAFIFYNLWHFNSLILLFAILCSIDFLLSAYLLTSQIHLRHKKSCTMKANQNAESHSHTLVSRCPIYYNQFYCHINLTGSMKQAFAIDWLQDQKVDTNEQLRRKTEGWRKYAILFLILFPQ